jgi:ABC-type Co2+ transport system permease subunit
MFDRGVIHVVVGYIVYHFCLMYDRGVIHVVVGYIVYQYSLRFDREVVHVVVVILSTITVECMTEE